MGEVFDTHMSQFIPAGLIAKSAGTWVDAVASNVPGAARETADAVFDLLIPIRILSNASAYKGARLKSIQVYWKTAAAALDAVGTVELEKVTLGANGTGPTGAAVAVTVDVSNDTDGERLTLASHTLTVTLDTPAWVDDDEAYTLLVSMDAAATSEVTLYGARANFDLRM